MSFGTQLRQARKRRRLTQKALADAIGVKHNSVSNWESDRNRPDPETIRALCALLEVDSNYFLETDPMESQLSGVEFAPGGVDDLQKPLHAHQLVQPEKLFRDLFLTQLELCHSASFPVRFFGQPLIYHGIIPQRMYVGL